MLLMLTSPRMRGPEVEFVQRALNTLHFYADPLDDGEFIFGDRMHDAVEAFQASAGLVVDGIVGQKTLNALHAALDAANGVVDPDPGADDLGAAIAKIAIGEVGTQETPIGSNITKYGAWFGWNGVAWCFIFVSWVFSKATKGQRYVGDWLTKDERKAHNVKQVFVGKGAASVPSGWRAFAAVGLLVERGGDTPFIPLPGDAIFYELDKDADPDHIGLCARTYDKDGVLRVEAIEGNDPSSVHSRTYSINDKRIKAFGRLSATVAAATP